MSLLSYIEKYNIEIRLTDKISIDIIMCIFILFAIMFFMGFIANLKKQNKIKNYTGKVSGTFVSAEAYDSKVNKKIKRALIRYTVNDNSIIKRMIVPKKQLKEDTLNIAYNVNNPNEAILIGDNTYGRKAGINFIITIIFVSVLIVYYIMLK